MGRKAKATEVFRAKADAIGGRMLKLRDWADFSLRDLQLEVGAVPATICEYENGKKQPPVWLLMRYCEVFQCRIEWLIYGTGEQFRWRSEDDSKA